MSKKNLYDNTVYQESLTRVDNLKPESQPRWGSMTSAQMMAHCAEVIEVSNGKPLEHSPFFVRLLKGMIRRMVLSEKPYRKNLHTHPQYIMASKFDFESERERFLGALSEFLAEEGVLRTHPIFGVLSMEEKGAAMYKHLNHHLEQFGV